MLQPRFIVAPVSSTLCCTCSHWEGARVVMNNLCHSLESAEGFCKHSSDGTAQYTWQLPIRLAPDAGCEAWQRQ